MPNIHHAINVAAPVDRIASLVSTGDGLREWWAEDVETTAEGVVTLGFFNRATLYRLRPLERTLGRVARRCETGKECIAAEGKRPGPLFLRDSLAY